MFVASKIYLNSLVDFTNQLFCLIPAQTGVSYRLTKDIRGILAAIFQVGFNHKATDIFANVFIPSSVDEGLADDALTTLMITHNMENAIAYGNRLVMLHQGRIVVDVKGEEKANLTVQDLMELFHKNSGQALANDELILN